MEFKRFSIRDGDLVGFGKGNTEQEYAIHFNIDTWKHCWEKKGIVLNDFLDRKAYILTTVRNVRNGKTEFIKIS